VLRKQEDDLDQAKDAPSGEGTMSMADSLGVKEIHDAKGAPAERVAVLPGGTGLSHGRARATNAARRAAWRKVNWLVGAIALPGLAVYAIAIVYPMIDTLYTSLFDWNIISGVHKYVGAANYTEFFHDGTFRLAAENTATWTVIYVPCVLALGLLVALWLNRPFRGRTLLRIVFYLPFVLSNVAAGLMWTFVYYPTIGAADTLTRNLGLGDVEFLASPHLVLFSVLVAFVWQGVGAMMVIFLAGLQSVPNELFEAAEVNGATS
jgi:ABC-type sugar transport system permease subunit